MNDETRTKKELVGELHALRNRVGELETSSFSGGTQEALISDPTKSLLDNLMEHVIQENKEMQILWANRAACKDTRMPLEELTGRYCYEILAKRTDPCPDCPVIKAMETEQPQATEKIMPDGRVWIIHGYPLRDFHGTIVGGMEITLNITDRIQAERKLTQYRDHLEDLVEQRTLELSQINNRLAREIEERIHTENELRKNEEKYRTILDNIGYGYFEIDLAGNLTFFNNAICYILGYHEDELVGMSNRAYTSEETARSLYKFFNEIYCTGKPATIMEFEILRKDGHARFIELSASLIRDPQDQAIGFRGIARDATERKIVQQKLQESENSYRTIFDTTGTAMMIVKADNTISLVNREFGELTGYSKEEIIGTSWVRFVAPKDQVKMRKYHHLRRIDPESAPRNYEFTLIDRHGTQKDIVITVALIPGTGISVASFLDSTTHKRLSKALADSESRFRALVEQSLVGVYIFDGTYFLYVNEAFAKIFGSKRSNLITGVNPLEYIHPEDRLQVESYLRWWQLKSNIDFANFDFRVTREDGSTVFVEVFGRPLEIEEQTVIIGTVVDITKRKQAEEMYMKYEHILSTVDDPMSFIDKDYVYRAVNDAYLKNFDRPREGIIGHSIAELMGKDIFEQEIRPYIDESLNGKRVQYEGWFYYPKLGKRYVLINYYPFSDENGIISGIAATSRDITDRKVAEEAMQESERRLADIINFLPDATFAIDLGGSVIAWNRAIEEMTGITAEDMLGKGNYEYSIPFYGHRRPILIDLVLTPDKEIENKYVFLWKEKDVRFVETDILHLRGKQHYMWAKASPIYDLSGNVVGAIESIRDITTRKQAEEALRTREQELGDKSRYLEEANTALKVLLEHREDDKRDLEENVLSNVRKFIVPYIEKLKKTQPSGDQNTYLEILESNLTNIVSPFFRNMTLTHFNLTPKELEIAHLIKEGKTTKEIADILNLSPRSIDFHRLNIREKLGLKSKKTNLRSTLLSYS